MRAALIIGSLVVVLVVGLAVYGAWHLWGLEFTREYDSYRAAAADNVFAGGWLPDFIPDSVTRMVVTNDYDVNISRGAFRYDPADTGAFLARLRPWRGGRAPFNDYAARAAVMETRGYRAYEFAAHGNVWVFFVNAADGHVEYDMWPDFARPPEEATDPP